MPFCLYIFFYFLLQNYLSHAWISEERVVVGTDSGELLVVELGELKGVLQNKGLEKISIDSVMAISKVINII